MRQRFGRSLCILILHGKVLGSLILAAAEDAAIAKGFTHFEMGSTLTGVGLYTLKGYFELERRQVPVGGGEAIEVVRMIKRL
jgi:hypothetical protein